jgi:GxxExxY protein
MHENEISGQIVDAAIVVHRALGPGLLESVYQTALGYELERRGLRVLQQHPIPVSYEGIHMGDGFRPT